MSSQLKWLREDPSKFKFLIHGSKMTDTFLRNPNLFPYQKEAVLKAREMILADEERFQAKIRNGQIEPALVEPVIIVAPTGAGKSAMICMLPYVLPSRKLLVITPSKVITNQLAIDFGKQEDEKCLFEKIGIFSTNEKIGSNEAFQILEKVTVVNTLTDLTERFSHVFITNAQKFGHTSKLSLTQEKNENMKLLEAFFQKFDTLIVDEAHHFPAKTWLTIVNMFGKQTAEDKKKIIFLTATPKKRNKGRKNWVLGTEEDTKKRIAYDISLSVVEKYATRKREFTEHAHSPTQKNVLNDVLDIINTHAQQEPRFKGQVMILVSTKEEAHLLSVFMNAETNDANFSVSTLGDNPAALKAFSNQEKQVAITCGVGGEGYDNPNVVSCIILRKIVHSRILFAQFVGRCMRKKRGLAGEQQDRTIARIVSYKLFEQLKMWNDMDDLADEDPVEVDINNL